jgi:hypothetical protein
MKYKNPCGGMALLRISYQMFLHLMKYKNPCGGMAKTIFNFPCVSGSVKKRK